MNKNLISSDPFAQVVNLKLFVVFLCRDKSEPVPVNVCNGLKVVVCNSQVRLFGGPKFQLFGLDDFADFLCRLLKNEKFVLNEQSSTLVVPISKENTHAVSPSNIK
jgi:hypothetical protein